MRQHQTVFANFVLKFGNENMVDYLKEIVLPAFTDDTLVRNRAESAFHLFDVKLFDDATFGPVIAGHFVHDTVLRRTHVFDEEFGLVEDKASMDSALSSLFVLILDNHKLIYHAEAPHSPELGTFETTIRRFLDKKHSLYISQESRRVSAQGNRITKTRLGEIHPRPNLNIILISDSEEVEAFVGRYSVLKRLDVVVHKPNDEIDASDSIAAIDFLRERLGADKAKLTVSEPEGLDQQGAIDSLKEAGTSGNHKIKLSGLDLEGNKLDGTNEDFSLRTQLEIPPLETEQMASRLLKKYEELTESGALSPAEAPAETRDRIRAAMREP